MKYKLIEIQPDGLILQNEFAEELKNLNGKITLDI